jgi:hypothetical protein
MAVQQESVSKVPYRTFLICPALSLCGGEWFDVSVQVQSEAAEEISRKASRANHAVCSLVTIAV